MPVNVRRFCISIFFLTFCLITFGNAQAPTSADVMRERLSKVKAYIAVRNYNAAIFELENIRRETSDTSVNSVATVLLMNSFLEQGDHQKAQELLNDLYKSYKSNSAAGNFYYNSVAAQVVKGARSQVERYRALGLSVSDRNLPLEAVNDIEQMRGTLELVITQQKELGADKAKAGAAMALLEEATSSRSMLARDDYDARRWQNEVADSREQIAVSSSVILNATDGSVVGQPAKLQTVAAVTPPVQEPGAAITSKIPPAETVAFKPVEDSRPATPEPIIVSNTKSASTEFAKTPATSEPRRPRVRENADAGSTSQNQTAETPKTDAPAAAEQIDVGSLIGYATKQQAPVYPPMAKNLRTTGVVKVEVTVDESGEVAEVQKASGPAMLQTAAKDAVKKWKFKPFLRDGQPVKATGFVSFNFTL